MLQREHSAILLTSIKLPAVIKTFVLSIFEWPFYTCFTVGTQNSIISLANCVDPDHPHSELILMTGITGNQRSL